MRPDDCSACALTPSRREFIRAVGASVAAALAAAGAPAAAGALVPITAIEPIGGAGATHTYPIPAADGVHIDKSAEVILVRWRNAVYAFNLSCPHQYTALRWNEGQHRFKCPKHSSRYEPDGTFVDGRATRGMDRFAIKRDGNSVTVDVEKMYKQDADPAGWTSAVVNLP